MQITSDANMLANTDPKKMTPKEIKILLLQNDITQAAIAKKLKVSRTSIHNVIKGIVESHRIKQAIASAVGMKVSELWPNKDGKRAA